MNKEEILKVHEIKKEEIENRLLEFRNLWNENDERIFTELCFCLCVPQSSAKRSWAAITELVENKKLFLGSFDDIHSVILKHGVRFPNNKTKWIVEAREKFTQNKKISIKPFLSGFNDPFETREWLVSNIKGIGYKLAGHFMRNVGLYQEHAILDIHILKNLKRLNIIDEIPTGMSKKQYLEIEEKFKELSKELNIPISHLDLIFWSNETGEIFK